MGIGLIFLGLGIIAAIIWAIYCENGFAFFLGLLASAAIFAAVSTVSSTIYNHKVGSEYVKVEEINIYSIGLHDSTYGSFTLGTGTIQTRFVYAFYCSNGDDYYTLEWVYADGVSIKETNDIQPCLVTYAKRYKGGKRESLMWSFGNDSSKRYRVLYVPEGTVVQSYSLSP